MAEQTSRLAIIIDSTGAKNNADNLTSSLVKMTQAGETAANSAGKVTKATEDEKNALAKLKAAIDPVGAAIDTVGRRYSELKKFFDKGLIDKEEYEFLVRKLNETTEELSGVAQAQREAEKAGKLAAAQQEAQAQAFQRMLDKIDPLAAALRNLEQQHDELNAAFASGKINGSQFENYSRKIQETRRELTGEAQAEREAAKAHDEQVVALQRLIAQLDPVGTAFNRLVEQQKQLNEAKAKGMLSPEMYEELSGKLRAMRSELEVTQSQLSKTGMSAKQTAFAMRMLPAQMTDKASETNAKSSETNAAKSAADALNYRNQAQGIVGTNIGLGSSPRGCSDISGNPSGYIGFMRIMADATGFPSIASGESSLTGFISQVDGTPAYTGVFQGWTTRSLYTYRWSPTTGPQWTRHARKNEVDRLDQWNSETWLYNHDKSMRLGLTGSTWGCYSDTQKKWIPLDVSHGGTGANSLDDAKTNLQIPEGGLTKAMTLNAPGGAVDGKYYPVIIDTSAMNGSGAMLCPVEIKTAGGPASNPLNSNSFFGFIRCGGWSDVRDVAYGSFVCYEKNELGILCIKASQRDYAQHVAFYIHKSAFPVVVQTGYKAKVKVPTEDYVIGDNGVRYKFGVSTSTEDNDKNFVKNVLDFTGGEHGFYSNLPFRQGVSERIALTNGLSFDKNFTVTIPIFVNNGQIKATQSFTAYGTDASNRTFVSQRLQSEGGPVVDQTELRAANASGEIVVRDINNSGNSKFFNFNLDGTFSSYQGLVVHTGQNWSTQHTENVNKFKPIAGSAGGPDGTMVVGGFHAQFSGNYVTQFAGRNSKFWARSFEAGVDKGWKRLLTVDDLNSSTDLAVRSLTTSNPVKSGGGRIDVLGSTSDYSKMDCFVRGFDSTGNSLAWALGSSVGVSKMLSLKNFFSGAEILLNGNDGAVQLKTGAVNGAKAQALTINKDEVNSTVDLTLTKQTGTGNRFVLQNSGNTELSFAAKVWGSSDRQNVFEVGTSAAYLFYAQKTSAGQLFDVNGAINCTTLNQSSDRDLKDDILVISDATKAIRKMNGYTYTLRENGMPYAGVIAQEVMEAIPEAVGSFTHYGEELQGPTVDGNELREETRYLNVDYSAVTGLLVQVARETDDRVTALEEENTTLRQNLAIAGTRISTLENQVSELVALVRQLTGSEH